MMKIGIGGKKETKKLRISNIKLEEISQVFRNKSKIIKH